jgi:hypothetical protein
MPLQTVLWQAASTHTAELVSSLHWRFNASENGVGGQAHGDVTENEG